MFILQFFLVFVLAILLFVVVFAFSLVFRLWNTIRTLFGFPPKQNVYGNANPWQQQQTGSAHQNTTTKISGGKPRTSTVDKEEGEYVDYEVIE